ncbi:MAG: hypothetical protein PHO32_08660, partial [Candidatus Cloacimonetes bacterium]|nr:hypothetical protein [Candidatus Cloacimonadota bacterium]
MRILCISNYYPPYFEGGYEISVKESMDYLAEMGHEIFILCGSKGVANPSLNWEYIPREPVRTLKYINYQHSSFMDKHKVEVFNYKATIKALKQLCPDLVYFGNMKAISIAPVIAAQNLKIPRIFDVGDIWLRIYTSPSLKSRLFRFLKRILPFTVGGDIHLDPVIIVS